MPKVGRDIGHGSNTWETGGGKGVRRNGKVYEEHDFNSKLAIELDKHLIRNGIDVVEIQKPFSPEVSLTERTDYYNQLNVDLVWSLHANAGVSSASGICAFYWHDHEQSKRAAKFFVEELNAAGFDTHGNGLHASMTGSWTNLHIVRETKMTAVLTENGFMTNPTDFEEIFGRNQKKYIKKLAVVHAKAICRYFGISYKGEPQILNTNEGEEIMKPTSRSIEDSVTKVLKRLEKKEGGISSKWREDFSNGKLTVSDAIGLIYVALDRGLIQGENNKEYGTANKDDITGHWAEEYIRKAKEAKLINGHTDGSWGPNEPLTRAQLAIVLDRLGLLD
jgi:N-acetylmuramoyl-L-alanine amidase